MGRLPCRAPPVHVDVDEQPRTPDVATPDADDEVGAASVTECRGGVDGADDVERTSSGRGPPGFTRVGTCVLTTSTMSISDAEAGGRLVVTRAARVVTRAATRSATRTRRAQNDAEVETSAERTRRRAARGAAAVGTKPSAQTVSTKPSA